MSYSISEKDFGFDVGWASRVNHTKLLLKHFRDAHRLTPKTLSESLYQTKNVIRLKIKEGDAILYPWPLICYIHSFNVDCCLKR